MKYAPLIILAVSAAHAGTCIVPIGAVAPANSTVSDNFGFNLAADGDVAIVGASNDSFDAPYAGAAIVYRRGSGGWAPDGVLRIGGPATQARFGSAVAVEGNLVLVSVPGFTFTPGQLIGGVLGYRYDGAAWQLTEGLQRAAVEINSGYGQALDVEGNHAMVSATNTAANGTVYTFTYNGTNWVEGASLTGPDNAHYYFGSRIVMKGDYAAILSSYGTDDGGAVYIYKRTGDAWNHTGTLTTPSYQYDDYFGIGLAMTEDRVAVGIRNFDHGDERVELFVRMGESWVFEQTILSPTPEQDEYEGFGYSIVLRNDRMFVGASNDASGNTCPDARGSVFAYDRIGTQWVFRSRIGHPDDQCATGFGTGMAMSGDSLLIAASYEPQGPGQLSTIHAFAIDNPVFTENPGSAAVAPGDTAQFHAPLGGLVPHTPTWRKNGAPLSDSAHISGSNTSTLTIHDAQPSDFGAYDCVVSNACGDVIASAPAAMAVGSASPPCPGDANGSGLVEFSDITTVLQYWGAACP